MSTHSNHDHSELGHILPRKLYVTVLVTLLILTVITVAISRVDFGNMNIIVAMIIASIKAGIVALFFMHLKYESPILWLYVGIPLVLLAIMLTGLFIDSPFRIDPHAGKEPSAIVTTH